ncbi:MAG: hypothetical protein PHX70_07910 [Clostridium sp.]|nr:hypothetical protein [Clostridium sp.]
MKCYKHTDCDAVSQCNDCGRGLCHECTNNFTVPLCTNCMIKRINKKKAALIKDTFIMMLLFVIGLAISEHFNIYNKKALFIGYIFAGFPWRILFSNDHDSYIISIIDPAAGFIGIIFKLIICICISVFMVPVKIFKIVTGFLDANKLEVYTKNLK